MDEQAVVVHVMHADVDPTHHGSPANDKLGAMTPYFTHLMLLV